MARANVVRIPSFNNLVDDLQMAIDGFLAYCKSKNLSDKTSEYYRYRLNAFSKYLADKEKPSAPISLIRLTNCLPICSRPGRMVRTRG